MIVTQEDVAKAEAACRDQRLANLKLLQVDASRVSTPEDRARCSKLWETAQDDPLKFDGWLAKPEMVRLFVCGALHFGGPNG